MLPTIIRRLLALAVTVLGLLSPLGRAEAVTGVLENPGNGSNQSGVGVVSGWICEAQRVTIVIDEGQPSESVMDAAYGTARGDTATVCGDSNNGFGVLFNWGILGDGEHTAVARARVNGSTETFGSATFKVTTLGARFVTGLQAQYVLPGLPDPESELGLVWQQGLQNFRLAPLAALAASTQAAPPSSLEGVAATTTGVLENPGNGSFHSGIGVVSGWACDANRVEVVINEGKSNQTTLETAYGTARGDTMPVCGDSNNGYGVLFNWGLLGDGTHTAVAKAFKGGDVTRFGPVTFTVTTLGESFVRGLSGGAALGSFPNANSSVVVEWQQGSQNLVITELADGGEVEAGPVAKGLGIGSYVVRAGEESDLLAEIDVRNPTGGLLGRIGVTFDAGTSDIVWRFVSPTEEVAILRSNISHSDDGESVLTRLDLEAVGRTLTERVRAEAEPSDDDVIEDMSLETPLPEGAELPTLGEVHGTTALTAVLPRVQNGQEVNSDEQMQAWFDQVGLQSLLFDGAATFVSAAFRDPNLAEALRARLGVLEPVDAEELSELASPASFDDDDDDPREFEDQCATVFGPKTGLACCSICTTFTPDIMPLGAFYTRSCTCCANLTHRTQTYLAECVEALNSPIYDDARCRADFTAKKPGFVMEADEYGRSCQEACSETACRTLCESEGGPAPPAGQKWCDFGCRCPVEDANALCRVRHPDTFCGQAITARNGALSRCPVGVCNDMSVQASCPEHPDLAETCDHFGSAGNVGCGEFSCADDCKSCQFCECTKDGPGTGGCPTGQRCNKNCRCEEGPTCATDPRDRDAAAPGRWCSMDSWCPRGSECDEAICRCKPVGTCGDGVCNTGAGENELNKPTHCPQDCPLECGDGKCNVELGEADPVRSNYCAADCPQQQCCVDTGGCPSEQPYSCPGECCCCPAGAVCSRGGVETPWVCGF